MRKSLEDPNQNVDVSTIAVITVTYHPDPSQLARQLRALPAGVQIVLVDNGSTAEEWMAVDQILVEFPGPAVVRNITNLGLAAAINQGAALVASLNRHTEFLLLMDQDSEPRENSVIALLEDLIGLESKGLMVGCVGPMLVDTDTQLRHGFHRLHGYRWSRTYPLEEEAPVRCANLNGSGTLMRSCLFEKLGGLDEKLFIDHVDTEWAFRVQAAGYALFGIPRAIFDHRMGEKSWRFWWFGWRAWPYRSPLRQRYLYRNATRLLFRDYVPLVWKIWAVAKLLLTCGVHLIFDRNRFAQVSAMLGGIKAGFLEQGGGIICSDQQ